MISVEGQVRLLLRAWPISDRVDRGEEILTTTLDLSPSGRRGLRLSLVASLLVGGLQARWRLRPPVWTWLNYAFQQTMPPRWQRWVRNDLLTRGWCRRMMAGASCCTWWPLGSQRSSCVSVIPLSLGDLMGMGISIASAGSLLGAVLAPSAWARKRRREILAEHGYDDCGPPDLATDQ